jgi:hypothetical protein
MSAGLGSRGLFLLLLSLVVASCGDDSQAQPQSEPVSAERANEDVPPGGAPLEVADPIELVPDCKSLERRAARSDADLALLPVLCPNLPLDHRGLRRVVLSIGSAAQASTMIAALDRDAELQGLVRLAILDRASQPVPTELPDPATALLTPIDDRILAAAALAHQRLREPQASEAAPRDPVADEIERTRAHAFLARVYLQGLQSLGLQPGRPLPPFARLLAGPALHHARSFCRFYWQRRVGGLERTFAEVEFEMLTLLVDLDNTPHAGDPALLAVERQQTRMYFEREGPRGRIAKRAEQRPDAGVRGTEVLLPFVHELDRLFDHRFIDLALERAMRVGAEQNGPGLDPLVAVVTEDLRERDLREYERRLARRVERARKNTPSSRHAGTIELEPELPVEWPDAKTVAEQAHAWLVLAHGRGPDFARAHARGRVVGLLQWRPDAIAALLASKPDDAAVREHHELLFALLDAVGDDDLASSRLRVAAERPSGSEAHERDARLRRRFALATRDALLHPR